MARAGYCSQCGANTYLREDGSCASGHGPECISSPYDVPEASAVAAPPAAYQAPQYSTPSPYAPPGSSIPYPAPVAQPAAPPRKKRTGLVIAIVIVLLLLLCCCGAGAAILAGAIPNPLASEEHQKVAAAGAFTRAVGAADPVALMKAIPADAAAAADPKFWVETLSDAEANAQLKSEKWDGDVLTQVYTESDGTEQTMIFEAAEGDTVRVTTLEDGEDTGDPGFFTMKKEATGWKVLALGSGEEELIRFDAETVKQIEEESQ